MLSALTDAGYCLPDAADPIARLEAEGYLADAPAAALLYPTLALPITTEEAAALDADPAWGAAEKANGQRALLQVAGKVTAHNRSGKAVPGLPYGAEALAALPDCILDGEWVPGGFAAFDLLADGDLSEEGIAAFRAQPCHARLARLVALFAPLGVVGQSHLVGEGPLWLLVPATTLAQKDALRPAVADKGGEGIVHRRMDAPSDAGRSRALRKEKFTPDLDAVVIGTNLPDGTSSLRLALYREDGALISVGNLRSGLTDGLVAAFEARCAAGERPVITVQYLAARTVGCQLVEPVYIGERSDKEAGNCTADQLTGTPGPDRRAAIAAAPARDA